MEQDLVLSRALVEIFSNQVVSDTMIFRGGTALHKLFLHPPGRYSEDIDLVQIEASAIGPVIDAIRASVDPWLGEPRRRRGQARVTMLYRFETTSKPVQQMRLKVEINTREHFSVLGLHRRALTIENRWFSGQADISVYQLEELLGTKLRALYQRKRGRDLYDLWLVLNFVEIDAEQVVDCFQRYMDHGGTSVSRAEFEANLAGKLQDAAFLEDIKPLLPAETTYDPVSAVALVRERFISKLSGEPWRGAES